ncbi:MBL fold metallo-hydrolase [Geitlerinema sp. PCC 7407]|uniref:MBL fold metallo-hydrolase n=1 Tax=Geitlerinema sp. PCC 7407 TaxID=1173025 RepID=UPI00059BE2E0|nr:MBL fold metallo-hydrolase [Geitlerinema sp. PCC 7407]
MKRRNFLRYAGASLVTGGIVLASSDRGQAQSTGPLSIQYLGHTCFLFSGSGRRILVNPFQPIGCTANYRSPKVDADLVLISSRLLDEGAVEEVPGSPRILFEPSVYQFDGFQVQGLLTDHDRLNGRRFGSNIVWKWTQGGVKILHMGGAAAPVTLEQQILMGRPDVLFIPVGGGPKAYNPQQAKEAIQVLNPKMIVPTQFRSQAADPNACDIVAVEEFLALMEGTPVRRIGSSMSLSSADIPENGPVITVFSYGF